ncbi:hypothetical protein U9M48_043372 [Paspalum notatum var. saurae]|uniref:Retrotransposon gag domain-containing protein n=1 Tax=Paspalum notatum var. saurae TaxID=547442 RepID=A0AAQ3UUJ0_PASNO
MAQCLHGPSRAWCASFLAMQPVGHQVTWDEFRAAYRAHYLPPSLIELKQREFRALQLSSAYPSNPLKTLTPTRVGLPVYWVGSIPL